MHVYHKENCTTNWLATQESHQSIFEDLTHSLPLYLYDICEYDRLGVSFSKPCAQSIE